MAVVSTDCHLLNIKELYDMNSQLKEFTTTAARPLPIIILADTSGSMGVEGKIENLNQAIREMLDTFTDTEDLRAEIHVAIITFGGTVNQHTPFMPASEAKSQWHEMSADGGTPMGGAMELAAKVIEDKNVISGRAYRPTVILVSDGQPTDSWKTGLDHLTKQGRAQKADRMALAIGADADVGMLQNFLGTSENKVFRVDDARRIKEFFRFVTMSVTARTRSANPNDIPKIADPFGLDQL
jgi:uncharacterized protein YegL